MGGVGGGGGAEEGGGGNAAAIPLRNRCERVHKAFYAARMRLPCQRTNYGITMDGLSCRGAGCPTELHRRVQRFQF